MSIFTKVPGIYRTREGGYAYVKYIHDGTGYPVIGCKAQLMPDKTVQWVPNIMQAYTLEGRCMEGKDHAEDIVAYDSARVVLIFRPMNGTPPPEDRTTVILMRGTEKVGYGQRVHQCLQYGAAESINWLRDIEWAELP